MNTPTPLIPPTTNLVELLTHSFETEKKQDPDLTPLVFLANHVFDFTTYDDQMSALFARKALDVCLAISQKRTFEYIKEPDNYRWFLIMVNMPFFSSRIDWGTSVRGAWWDHTYQTLESCGIRHQGSQCLSLKFAPAQWQQFILAMDQFAPECAEES